MRPKSLVLDSEGLCKVIHDDHQVMTFVQRALHHDAALITSAVTLVAVRNPRTSQARFDWALSRIEILPVSEQIARQASRLLADASLHGHKYALDALVAATALLVPSPAVILTSDPDDLAALVQDRARVVKV